MKLVSRMALITVAALSAGCASASGGGRSNARMIDVLEIRESGFTDAFTLIQALRPHWLSTRGPTSLSAGSPVLVYLDGSRLGGVGELRSVSTRALQSLEYMDPLQATQRWGLDHGSGAIVATSIASGARR